MLVGSCTPNDNCCFCHDTPSNSRSVQASSCPASRRQALDGSRSRSLSQVMLYMAVTMCVDVLEETEPEGPLLQS
jgi:hypothetical protein